MPRPKIYVASMKLRGAHAPLPVVGAKRVNVTSAQATASKWRRDFSPMSPIAGGYRGFYCFENYWQSHKSYAELGHTSNPASRAAFVEKWRRLQRGKRRLPETKKFRAVSATYEDGVERGYVDSRRAVYVPQYYELVKDTESIRQLQREYADENSSLPAIVIYDFDGPRDPVTRENAVAELSIEMLKEKIADAACPFGHGYVVAATIAGISPEMYCGSE